MLRGEWGVELCEECAVSDVVSDVEVQGGATGWPSRHVEPPSVGWASVRDGVGTPTV